MRRSMLARFLLCLLTASAALTQSNRAQLNAKNGFALPAPGGSYAVGRISFHWIDATRPEPMTEDPNDHRELMVYLWYPAESNANAPDAPYVDKLELLQSTLEPMVFNLLGSARIHAQAGAIVSFVQSRYPVIIFSPGNHSNAATYATLIEELASQGYMVAAIDHPYQSDAVLFPDQRVVRYSDKGRPQPNSPNVEEAFSRYYRAQVETRAADAVFVLNQLEKLNQDKADRRFHQRLDLHHLGIFGHSMGGIAASQTCLIDRRFKAALNLDGRADARPLCLDAKGNGPQQAFMTLEKPLPEPTEQNLQAWQMTREQVAQVRAKTRAQENTWLETVRSGSYRVVLKGATHSSFSDEPLLLALGNPTLTAAHRRRTEIIRKYTLAFFDKHLKNKPTTLLDRAASDYQEVTVERFGRN